MGVSRLQGSKIQSPPGAGPSFPFFSCSVTNRHKPQCQEKGQEGDEGIIEKWPGGEIACILMPAVYGHCCFFIGALKRERYHPKHCSLSR